jgi:hypothetical protein
MAIRVVPGGRRRSPTPAEQTPVLPPYLSPTELLHPRAAVPTVVMLIANLPSLAPPEYDDVYRGLEPFSAALGLLGVVATVGLLRRADWGTPLVLATAVLNVLLGEVALAMGLDHGLLGIALGLLTLALATAVPRRPRRF